MDRLGGLVVIALARRAVDPGSNPGPGKNFLKLLILYIYYIILFLFCKFVTLCLYFMKSDPDMLLKSAHFTAIVIIPYIFYILK